MYLDNPKEFTKNLLELKSSARLQDTLSVYRKQLCFCTLAMDNPKIKLRKQFHLQEPNKIKYLEINLTKKCKTSTLKIK